MDKKKKSYIMPEVQYNDLLCDYIVCQSMSGGIQAYEEEQYDW